MCNILITSLLESLQALKYVRHWSFLWKTLMRDWDSDWDWHWDWDWDLIAIAWHDVFLFAWHDAFWAVSKAAPIFFFLLLKIEKTN